MSAPSYREIPYNYTSADDRKIIELLFSKDVWQRLENLREVRKSGRSAKLLLRIIGEIFIHFRNPYLQHHLANSLTRRKHFFAQIDNDLEIIKTFSQGNTDVLAVVKEVEQTLSTLKQNARKNRQQGERLIKTLGQVVQKENVLLSPMWIISHITDATDWRLYPPVAVVRPTSVDQIAPLLKAISQLNYKVIVRGGGTGLTGGAVPTAPDCVIINTEKLNRIYPIETLRLTGDSGTADSENTTARCVRVEAGAITEDVMTHALEQNLIFASDPTSAWASTIGGNISENAGGKSAVKWGTTIDNLLSYRMAMPNGEQIVVRRLNHPLRKIIPGDSVKFEIQNTDGEHKAFIELNADQIRKPGLWKDITNKALSGLPGIQKEGTDGIILEGTFILYNAYSIKKTFCLEFFGSSFNEASRVIEQITNSFTINDDAALIALEHFDQEYIKAIEYKVKSNISHSPKAVLLIDMAADVQDALHVGEKKIRDIIAQSATTEVHVAQNDAEAKRFWHDRHQLGAIAKRTNAFKLNEDIVLPLHALAPFSDWVDEINRREAHFVQIKAVHAISAFLSRLENTDPHTEIHDKLPALRSLCNTASIQLVAVRRESQATGSTAATLSDEIEEILRGYQKWQSTFAKLFRDTLDTVLVLATHMHAGDGNIHVNIPVFSNDVEMMERAESLVDEVMEKTISLGGVVSGEHGIGITKIKYLEAETIEALREYRQKVDEANLMNPNKLVSKSILDTVFTPSFNLLELEARILKRGKLEALANKIAHCVRCGKCKSNCCVFHPAQNLFFHPRNKNLAIGSLIEAILYDAQRHRDTEFELLQELEEIADHCTVCHKCLKPCPVNIDTGEISVLERNLLGERGIKKTAAATSLTLRYLSSDSKALNHLIHTSVLFAGTRLQQFASFTTAPLRRIKSIAQTYPMQLLNAPMPAAPFSTLRSHLPDCDTNQALVFNPQSDTDSAVFYFPGCGSERLMPDISLAALYLLLKAQYRVILPPPFLCCGFPIGVNAKEELHNKIVLKDTIVLSQIRDMFAYLQFKAVAVTCGTCREALEQMGIQTVFNAPVQDVLHIAAPDSISETSVLYHRPCHDSLEESGVPLLEKMGCTAKEIPNCCAEAGTLSLSRPDISGAMRNKKKIAIQDGIHQTGASVILTNCPSCVQGLKKQQMKSLQATHTAVYAALQLGGANWKKELRDLLCQYERVTV